MKRGYVTFEDIPAPVGWETNAWGEEGEIETEVRGLSPAVPEAGEDHQGEAEEAGEATTDFVTRRGRKTRAPVKYSE